MNIKKKVKLCCSKGIREDCECFEQGRQETLKEVYDLWIKSTDYLDFQTHFLEVLLNQRLEKQKGGKK